MKKIKILLAGTPEFSVKTFREIINNFEVIAIISQPDRLVGRKQILTPPPIANLAKEKKIKLFQPEKISQIYEILKELEFDLMITMAYGQIIPETILELPKLGSYNIHASLLPKYRGAAPIQYSLANGDEKTGITFMQMVKKMDAGDIIFQEEIIIDESDNFDSLSEKLSDLSSLKITEWINNIYNQNFKKEKQDESKVSFCPKISKEDELIQINTIDKTINKIRSLSSSPGAYIFYEIKNTNGEVKKIRLKIFKASRIKIKNAIEIKCLDGSIYAIEYQFEGKKKIIL